jgi:threonine synthase
MDVGDPSNFGRMIALYEESLTFIAKDVAGFSFTDDETKAAMKKVFAQAQYVLDPHGAIGYLGIKEYLQKEDATGVFLETAHPAKFLDTVKEVVGEVEIPDRLKAYLSKQKKSIEMGKSYEEFKGFLTDR